MKSLPTGIPPENSQNKQAKAELEVSRVSGHSEDGIIIGEDYTEGLCSQDNEGQGESLPPGPS